MAGKTPDNTAAKQDKQKRILPLVLIIVAIVAAVALIVTGIVLKFGGNRNPYSHDLVAEIHLSDGTVLAYELYYNDAPITVANFVTRAKGGFYNNSSFYPVRSYQTVGTLLMGGIYREGFNSQTASDDDNAKLSNTNFKYEIKKESANTARQAQRQSQGSMFTWRDASTSKWVEGGFGIYLHEYKEQKGKSDRNYFSSAVMFAAPCDEETRAFIAELADAEVDSLGIPVEAKYKLTIKKVKIFAKDTKKWKNFDCTTEWVKDTDYKTVK